MKHREAPFPGLPNLPLAGYLVTQVVTALGLDNSLSWGGCVCALRMFSSTPGL